MKLELLTGVWVIPVSNVSSRVTKLWSCTGPQAINTHITKCLHCKCHNEPTAAMLQAGYMSISLAWRQTSCHTGCTLMSTRCRWFTHWPWNVKLYTEHCISGLNRTVSIRWPSPWQNKIWRSCRSCLRAANFLSKSNQPSDLLPYWKIWDDLTNIGLYCTAISSSFLQLSDYRNIISQFTSWHWSHKATNSPSITINITATVEACKGNQSCVNKHLHIHLSSYQ